MRSDSHQFLVNLRLVTYTWCIPPEQNRDRTNAFTVTVFSATKILMLPVALFFSYKTQFCERI